MEMTQIWSVHELEVWTAAFDKWQVRCWLLCCYAMPEKLMQT